MAMGPCLNPNCKSHGKPHPNCRCYDGMAKGGDVSHFCSEARMHNADCEYYAEGGDTDLGLEPVQNKDSDLGLESAQGKDSDLGIEPVKDDADQKEVPKHGGALSTIAGTLYDAADRAGIIPSMQAYVHGQAKGVLSPPIASLAEEKLLGIKPEKIKEMEANPASSYGEAAGLMGAGELRIGWGGILGTIGALGNLSKEANLVPKVAARVLSGVAEMGLWRSGEEANKAILHDPAQTSASALADLKFSGIMGAAAGSLAVLAPAAGSAGLKAIENQKWAKGGAEFLQDFGDRWLANVNKYESQEAFNPETWSNAIQKSPLEKAEGLAEKAADVMYQKVPHYLGAVGAGGGALEGAYESRDKGLPEMLGTIITRAVQGGVAAKATPFITDKAMPFIIKALGAHSPEAIGPAIEYARAAERGSRTIGKSIESLFNAGTLELGGKPENIDKIKKFIDGDGLDQQMQNEKENDLGLEPAYAEGGEVQNPFNAKPPEVDHSKLAYGKFGEAFPEHNILLNAAKGRVYNYLRSVKPEKIQQRLAFDSEKKNPAKDRSYNKAVGYAAEPLSIMHKIKDGSITPEDVKHFNSMWPDLHDHLKQKMTERIVKAQLSGEKPSYKVRQAMSLFMGAPLDSSMTPQSIAAAQAVFMKQSMQKEQAAQSGQTPKKNTSKLSNVSKSYLSPDQSAISRQQRAR